MDTLVRDPFREVMPVFFGMSLAEMMELKHPNAWRRFELGELTESEFLASFFADGRSYDHEGFRRAIRAAYTWLDGMEALLVRLSERDRPMHVLSNYPVWHTWIEERLGLSRYVDWSFVSCNMGLRKPAPDIFRRAAHDLGLSPEQCLLVDDRRVNCEGARSVGMQALHYRADADALALELEQLGLL